MKTLYWLTHDLRLDDNPCIARAAASESLIMVYCINPRWFSPFRYHLPSLGTHRWNFLQESISDFNRSLLDLGQRLLVVYQRPEIALCELIDLHKIERLCVSRQFGYDEIEALRYIGKTRPELVIEQVDSYTLFDDLLEKEKTPFNQGKWPSTFSQFRRKAEQLVVPDPRPIPAALPPSPLNTAQSTRVLQRPDWVPSPSSSGCEFRGGENAAEKHLSDYLSGDLPLHYKEVRNSLDGWENSSKMSPWLNSGCLSPRRLKAAISDYEEKNYANDSTEWLFVELLWREYFQWTALRLGTGLFSFKGTAKASPLTSYYPERFQKWCFGGTPYPLVNACMNQLAETGYLSNRGRQIAASCLVNELEVDWRHGAAWFEHQLVDYDVAANWGNWQYIAGVGADPRGGRHFNLDKQTEMFDSDGRYRQRWVKVPGNAVLDTRDAADWPIDIGET
ncbi:MAG TPA: deoxyribodipyrimidine photolyase [Gammaproteobacteria bacterium]|nr:deoxyribodipyrimidine photolyase [Gammaproteobacteria bacterium]